MRQNRKTSLALSSELLDILSKMAEANGVSRSRMMIMLIVRQAAENPGLNLTRHIMAMGYADKDRITKELLAKVLKTDLEQPQPVNFIDQPLGTRFTYRPDSTDVWIILERHGCGKVASDETTRGWVAGQSICSATDSTDELQTLKIYPLP